MKEVVVVIGPGQIGQAIARRIAFGKRVLFADKMHENAEAAAKVLSNAGYDCGHSSGRVVISVGGHKRTSSREHLTSALPR
jgi:lactate dehydrogenase-like 2-hydroxyacid dehydrogenase